MNKNCTIFILLLFNPDQKKERRRKEKKEDPLGCEKLAVKC
jgi:hypothetical protein